jgi:hypothetical protein
MTEINNGRPPMTWTDYQGKLARGEIAAMPPHP